MILINIAFATINGPRRSYNAGLWEQVIVVRIYTLTNPTQFGLSQGLLARILALRYEK